LTLDRTSIDGEVSKIGQELLCTILALDELEKIWGIINELDALVRE
jgi:hypothetical protein